MDEKTIARFWSKVDRGPECWLWTASLNHGGYGRFCLAGRVLRAHLVAWEIASGPIPESLCVLHECDVRHCVRPDHLFLGTRADNMQDMLSKGRGRAGDHRGESNGRARLSTTDVVRIRELAKNLTCRDLANMFSVHRDTIRDVTTRRRWKHIA